MKWFLSAGVVLAGVLIAVIYGITRNQTSIERALSAEEIEWDDLIPAGLPYGEIIGDGMLDNANDIWKPEFDENSFQLNAQVVGRRIKMPGYIVPLEISGTGVSSFLLVPYAGACVHTPPPPPNQIVLVSSNEPYALPDDFSPVWVTGVMRTNLTDTEIAVVGYELMADLIEPYGYAIPEME